MRSDTSTEIAESHHAAIVSYTARRTCPPIRLPVAPTGSDGFDIIAGNSDSSLCGSPHTVGAWEASAAGYPTALSRACEW